MKTLQIALNNKDVTVKLLPPSGALLALFKNKINAFSQQSISKKIENLATKYVIAGEVPSSLMDNQTAVGLHILNIALEKGDLTKEEIENLQATQDKEYFDNIALTYELFLACIDNTSITAQEYVEITELCNNQKLDLDVVEETVNSFRVRFGIGNAKNK